MTRAPEQIDANPHRRNRLSRRRLLQYAAYTALSACASPPSAKPKGPLLDRVRGEEFKARVKACMAAGHIPGLSLAVIDAGRIVHTAGYGWADVEAKRAMTADTLMNIASITKTITCTALMQLWEQKRFQLDEPVDAYLSFRVRNPNFPGRAITIRQLMRHRSSIADGPAYDASYACGDSSVSLESWLRGYLTAGGATYDAARNFTREAPGAKARYSNVAYGVLGQLVAAISGLTFAEYCQANIFAPLRMDSSRFLLAGLDRATHATPYTYLARGALAELPVRDPAWLPPKGTGHVSARHCLYSFATLSDGLARTSAAELARFLLAYIQGGELEGQRILQRPTLDQIFRPEPVPEFGDGVELGLTWWKYPGGLWGHSGGDPGVSTMIRFRPGDGRGLVLLANAGSSREGDIHELATEVFA